MTVYSMRDLYIDAAHAVVIAPPQGRVLFASSSRMVHP